MKVWNRFPEHQIFFSRLIRKWTFMCTHSENCFCTIWSFAGYDFADCTSEIMVEWNTTVAALRLDAYEGWDPWSHSPGLVSRRGSLDYLDQRRTGWWCCKSRKWCFNSFSFEQWELMDDFLGEFIKSSHKFELSVAFARPHSSSAWILGECGNSIWNLVWNQLNLTSVLFYRDCL